MTQTIALQIKNPFANQLKKGYPLISKDAVVKSIFTTG